MDNNEIESFFIFGSPRSGTSLLSRMMDSHEHLVVPQESLLFKMFSSFLKYYGDLSLIDNQKTLLEDMLKTRVIGYWSPQPKYEDVLALIVKPGFGGVVEALIRSTAPDKQLRLWGEKSPGHVFYWSQIIAAFPNAKIVHIIRDGRDVASSLLNARMGPKTYYAAGKLWVDYIQQMDRVKGECAPENYVEIHYEALLSEPEKNLKEICKTLGIDYSDSMLRFFENDSLCATDARNRENLQMPLMASNKEKWRSKMSKKELQEFETVAGDDLKKHGYELANELGALPVINQLWIKNIYSPAIRFISRAKDRQGHKEFLSLQSVKAKRVMSYYLNLRNL